MSGPELTVDPGTGPKISRDDVANARLVVASYAARTDLTAAETADLLGALGIGRQVAV